MTRLFVVMALTLVAFFVALYSWNRAPRLDCSIKGMDDLLPALNEKAAQRPRVARQELRKLAERTRLDTRPESFDALIAAWQDRDGGVGRRDCQRLQETIKRLW